MAVVEEPAALSGLEPCRSLTDTDLADMKNTARKSTAKLTQVPLTEKVPTSPSAITNGITDNLVSNGNGSAHKRPVEPEELENPAKAARLHIEEMENAQEVMTHKLSREEAAPQNGEGGESNGSQDSKQSQNSKASLLLTADVRNNFKGILDVAMNKIGSRRRSSNESSHSSHTKGDITDQPLSGKSQQQNGEIERTAIEITEETPGKTPEEILATSKSEPEKTTDEILEKPDVSVEKTELVEKPDVTEKNDVVENPNLTVKVNNGTQEQNTISETSEKKSDITENKDSVTSQKTDDKSGEDKTSEKTDDKAEGGDEAERGDDADRGDETERGDDKTSEQQNKTEENTPDVQANGDAPTEDVLLGTDGDVEGDVDDAVLLSDEDNDVDKVKDVAKELSGDDIKDVDKVKDGAKELSGDDNDVNKVKDVAKELSGDDNDVDKDKDVGEEVTKDTESWKDKDKEIDSAKSSDFTEKTDDSSKQVATEKNDDSSKQTTGVSSEEPEKAKEVETAREVDTTKEAESVKDSVDMIDLDKAESATSESEKPAIVDSVDLVYPQKDSSESDSAKPADSADPATKDAGGSNCVKVPAVNVKGIDVPADSIINLDDDEDEDNSQGPDNPIEIEDDVDMDNKSEASDISRKRNATSPVPSDASSTTKKSRLDKVIGRLGTAIGLKPSELAGDESANIVNDMKADDKSASGTVGNDADSKAGVSLVKPDTKPQTKPAGGVTKENIITAAASEINGLLVTRMNAYFNRTRDSEIVQYQRQIGELQAAVESWRAQAKRLAKQLDEQRLAQNRNPRKKRRANSEDPNRNVQLQAATLQQQGGVAGGKVVVRGPGPRTPPRTPGMAPGPGVNNVKHNTTGPQIRTVTAAQAAQAQAAQGKTVRDLLDKQRSGEPGTKVVGGRFVTPSGQLLQRGLTPAPRAPGTGTAIRSVHPAGKSVIDLTDDDDRRTGPPTADRVVRGPTPTGVAVRGPAPPGGAARQGPVLVQQMPTNGGPVIVQQVMTSQAVRAPPGTYVYTSRPGTAPGTITMQSAPGTSLVRPAVVTSATPPALRPAAQTVTVTRMPGPASLTRPPPPLRSAPTNANNTQAKHPAPLPAQPDKQSVQAKGPPPKPGLKISRVQSGIVLSWNMTVSDSAASIASYQLFAYQETSAAPATSLWKKVGDVKALPLPMACTLTQFQEGNKYHFAVRAVDVHSRVGPFSEPSSISLTVINVS